MYVIIDFITVKTYKGGEKMEPMNLKIGEKLKSIRNTRALSLMGRGQGPAEKERPWPLRRPAAAALHRPRPGRGAGGAADG